VNAYNDLVRTRHRIRIILDDLEDFRAAVPWDDDGFQCTTCVTATKASGPK
jgi:hypothetical protein